MKNRKIKLVFDKRLEEIKMRLLVNGLNEKERIETIDTIIGKHRKTLFDITTGILDRVKYVLEKVKTDVVLAHGDIFAIFVTLMEFCNPYGDEHVCKRIVDILECKGYRPWVTEQ